MSIVIGDVLRVVAILSFLDGNIVQNVFNAVITGTGGPYDEDDIVDDALDWVETIYANLASVNTNTIDGSEVRVYIYDSVDDDWDEVGSSPWVFNPTQTANALPRGVAGLINCKTTDPDVSGKKYIGALTEASAGASVWEANALASFANFADDWLTAFVGAVSTADWVPGVWSPTETNFFAASGVYLVPAIPAYQRRRKQGVGI